MSYIFGKLWHSAIIWPISKSFQRILQGVRFLLAKQTRLSGTSDNESYEDSVHFSAVAKIHVKLKIRKKKCLILTGGLLITGSSGGFSTLLQNESG